LKYKKIYDDGIKWFFKLYNIKNLILKFFYI
jgi:hypothetical protein